MNALREFPFRIAAHSHIAFWKVQCEPLQLGQLLVRQRLWRAHRYIGAISIVGLIAGPINLEVVVGIGRQVGQPHNSGSGLMRRDEF